MPHKPTNPTPRDLDEAIQSTNQRLDELIQTNQRNIQSAIGASTQTFDTRLDNQDLIMDSHFATLTAMLNKKFVALTTHTTAHSTSTAVHHSPGPSHESTSTVIPNLTSLPVSIPNNFFSSGPSFKVFS